MEAKATSHPPSEGLNAEKLGCDQLYTVRNGIFASRGYCFKTGRAQDEFGNEGETLSEQVLVSDVSSAGAQGIEIQGAWEGTDPSWPMGGLFISRMVTCAAQNRTYLLDTWLYAPGPRRSKYEYMIQLQTILGTFECA